MPRSVLRPPALRVVASRAMGTLCRLLEGGFTALKALSRRPYRPRLYECDGLRGGDTSGYTLYRVV